MSNGTLPNFRKKMKAHLVKQNSAATMIQRSYRGHVARELVRVMRVMKVPYLVIVAFAHLNGDLDCLEKE